MQRSQSLIARDADLIERFCDIFHLGELERVHGRIGGSFNVNIKFETEDGLFILRKLNHRITEDRLRHIRQILSVLSREDVPVLFPLTSPRGEYYARVSGSLLQAFPFIEGDSFACQEEQVAASAHMLSRFHRALEAADPGPLPHWSFYRNSAYYFEAFEQLKGLSGISSSDLALAEKWADCVLQVWEENEEVLPATIVHGDWHFWNQIYRGGNIMTVLDFDYIQSNKRILDVAYALWVIYMLLPQYSRSFDCSFMNGYGALQETEQSLLAAAVSRISLFFLCQSAHSPNPAEKWKDQFKKQAPLLEWLHSAEGKKRMQDLCPAWFNRRMTPNIANAESAGEV
jgi:Ser/Thr protein kinase RdoA (MazF antagonist)